MDWETGLNTCFMKESGAEESSLRAVCDLREIWAGHMDGCRLEKGSENTTEIDRARSIEIDNTQIICLYNSFVLN